MPARPASDDMFIAATSVQDVMVWYGVHARDLSWRQPGTTSWEVLVSKVMSQQTPVARVVPAWQERIRRRPGPVELTQAPTVAMPRVWSRLSYPRQAPRLVECARNVAEQHGSVLSDSLDTLLALPGVGGYTAGAVLAFVYGRYVLVLNMDVRWILTRIIDGQALPAPSLNRAERKRALGLLPDDDATAAHRSVVVMELGALVCTAHEPDYGACPWQAGCAWLAAGRPADVYAGQCRSQAWHGIDRRARGLMVARLRTTPDGQCVEAAELRVCAVGAGTRTSGGARDPEQPVHALSILLADGLIAAGDGGATYRPP